MARRMCFARRGQGSAWRCRQLVGVACAALLVEASASATAAPSAAAQLLSARESQLPPGERPQDRLLAPAPRIGSPAATTADEEGEELRPSPNSHGWRLVAARAAGADQSAGLDYWCVHRLQLSTKASPDLNPALSEHSACEIIKSGNEKFKSTFEARNVFLDNDLYGCVGESSKGTQFFGVICQHPQEVTKIRLLQQTPHEVKEVMVQQLAAGVWKDVRTIQKVPSQGNVTLWQRAACDDHCDSLGWAHKPNTSLPVACEAPDFVCSRNECCQKEEGCIKAEKTCGGTAGGVACKFPFEWHGLTHDCCTNHDADEPWCMTADGENEWGFCLCDEASATTTPVPTPAPQPILPTLQKSAVEDSKLSAGGATALGSALASATIFGTAALLFCRLSRSRGSGHALLAGRGEEVLE